MSNAVATRPQGNLRAMVMMDFFTVGWRSVGVYAVLVLLGACAGRGGMYLLIAGALVPTTTLTGSQSIYRIVALHDTLPVSRARVVTAMYVTLLLVDVGVVVLALAGGLVSRLWLSADDVFAPMAVVGIGLGILMFQAMLIPASIKWGHRAGAILLIVGLLALGLFAGIMGGVRGINIRLPRIVLPPMPVPVILGVVVCLVLLALSWVISVRIYQRQDH